MRKLISLKSIGFMILSVVTVGCAQGPEERQVSTTMPQAVNVAKAEISSPVAVVRAGYQTSMPSVDNTAVPVIDNSACSIGFCPLPLRKPKTLSRE